MCTTAKKINKWIITWGCEEGRCVRVCGLKREGGGGTSDVLMEEQTFCATTWKWQDDQDACPWWRPEKVLAWWVTVVLIEKNTLAHTKKKKQVWKHRWKWGGGGWVGWRGDVERTWHEARISWELDGRGAVPKLDRRPASVCVYVRACVCMSGVHPYTKHLAHTEGKREQKTLRQTLNTK